MDNVISFTPAQLWAGVLALCAGITCIAGAIAAVNRWIQRAKSPEVLQNQRIEQLEEEVNSIKNILAKDKVHLESLDEGNRVTQKALLALLAHGIDGNEIDSMRMAKQELQDYLISR